MEEKEKEDSVEIDGDEKKKVVLKALEEKRSFEFTHAKRHVVVIDEMNRGNISRIFGELLTMIEEDKRVTTENEMIVELLNYKEKYSLSQRLFVIVTMNTEDR